MTLDKLQQRHNKLHARRRKAAVKRQKIVNKTKLKTLQSHKTDKGISDYMEFRGELKGSFPRGRG